MLRFRFNRNTGIHPEVPVLRFRFNRNTGIRFNRNPGIRFNRNRNTGTFLRDQSWQLYRASMRRAARGPFVPTACILLQAYEKPKRASGSQKPIEPPMP